MGCCTREAALAAVQIFNNPNVTFKSETFVVLMIIAWTYLMHAYYREKNIDYRYFDGSGKRKKYDKTKHGAYKYWELQRCIDCKDCPLPRDIKNNLRFLIGLRHEIEHQMTSRIDDNLSAKFQACCINYHEEIEKMFGENYGIARHLAVSLQFASLEKDQVELLGQHSNLPKNIKTYIEGFDGNLSEEEYCSQKFAYRVLFVAKTANNKNQADRVIEFIKADSDAAKQFNASIVAIKEMERKKYLPKDIVRIMNEEGFNGFKMHLHTNLWRSKSAKDPSKGYGVEVVNTWYWYESWLGEVRKHCKESGNLYKC